MSDSVLKKISAEEFSRFTLNYFHYEKYGQFRFGQAFMNIYFPHVGGFCEIYYGENALVVSKLIAEKFVEK